MMAPYDLAAFRRSVLDDPLTQDVWRDKYRYGNEASIAESRARVVRAVYTDDPDKAAYTEALDLVNRGILVPAGRVNAGAGTGNRVTLLNCFVNETVQDSMPGIQRAIARAALTMQQGGGIGTDWSTVRPAGALVRRTGSVSSGVIPFMDQMDAMCQTVISAGTRRGAMMATLRDDHPDLWNPDRLKTGLDVRGAEVLVSPSFISAKRTAGRLTQFNVSVLISDAFLKVRDEGGMWDLGFHAPRADGNHIAIYDKPFPYDAFDIDENLQFRTIGDQIDAGSFVAKNELRPWYVYRRVPARQLWDEIMRSTYVYAEPGVIFIDRINERNNLNYFEDIRCTNPCGEIPMPADNVCCLSSVNLAFLVLDPFTPSARIDMELYHRAIRAGVRFLDNVLDVTDYPLEAQRAASMNTRRIGLGITGFGDALVQMGARYGSEKSVNLSRYLSQTLQIESYAVSANLAKERGSFPAFKADEFLRSYNVGKLPGPLQGHIREHGIRNGVLNTIAPNGTISLYAGNVSSGHEPVFSFRPFERKVRQPDGTTRSYEVMPYSLRLWRHIYQSSSNQTLNSWKALPDYFVGATDISPEEHLLVHGAWSEHLDHAASKTVNCPASMSFEDFAAVYGRAYALGAKGCTTYRPDPASGRGSVLSEAEVETGPEATPPPAEAAHDAHSVLQPPISDDSAGSGPPSRPAVLNGRTYKIKWPVDGVNWYVTVTNDGRRVREIFIAGGDPDAREWVEALARTATAVLRRDGDVRFLAEELERVASARGGAFVDKIHRPSVVAAIGGVLRAEVERLVSMNQKAAAVDKIARRMGFFKDVKGIPLPSFDEMGRTNDRNEIRWRTDTTGMKPMVSVSIDPSIVRPSVTIGGVILERCPKCGGDALIREAGCSRCLACGWERCG